MNVWLNFIAAFRPLAHPGIKELRNYRHSHGLPGKLPIRGLGVRRSVHTLFFGLPELEFPITLPPNIGLYGPVTLDSIPLSKEGELSTWLDGGKTIMISLGSHFYYSEAQVRNAIRGFIAGTSSTYQVFWKLHEKAKFQRVLDEELGNERVKGRFRIVDWIDEDPGEVLRHENIVAYVHHGGANSYYEAAR
jgi:UDP:flavonoid glycosyltransferase YjiC (YdhE family)